MSCITRKAEVAPGAQFDWNSSQITPPGQPLDLVKLNKLIGENTLDKANGVATHVFGFFKVESSNFPFENFCHLKITNTKTNKLCFEKTIEATITSLYINKIGSYVVWSAYESNTLYFFKVREPLAEKMTRKLPYSPVIFDQEGVFFFNTSGLLEFTKI